MQQSLDQIKKYFIQELESHYTQREAGQFFALIADKILQKSKLQLLLDKDEIVEIAQAEKIHGFIKQLKLQNPIQYLLGEADFYGLKLKVNSSVLIPRPETEELVEWIIHSVQNEFKIEHPSCLDIGTGSGCIPLSLKENIQHSQIYGMDISPEALFVAKENGSALNLDVEWLQSDILELTSWDHESLDLIVSNPPYIPFHEKKLMAANVLEFEPEIALFVEDEDPLIFYRKIALFAAENLKSGGLLFFEINEFLGQGVLDLLTELNFTSPIVRKDLSGKDRMVRAIFHKIET